jgi:hypothetical protein
MQEEVLKNTMHAIVSFSYETTMPPIVSGSWTAVANREVLDLLLFVTLMCIL